MSGKTISSRGSGMSGTIAGKLRIDLVHARPRWRRWRGWDLLKVLKFSYWGIKILHGLGQLLGLLRERLRPPVAASPAS